MMMRTIKKSGPTIAGQRHCLVLVESLDTNTLQPKNRTKNVKDLRDRIMQKGLVNVVHFVIVDGKNILVDGHRRVAAARALGHQYVQAMLHEIPPTMDAMEFAEDLFLECNVETKRYNDTHFMHSWAQAANRDQAYANMKKSFRSKIDYALSIYGEDETVQKVLDGYISPNKLKVVKDILERLGGGTEKEYKKFIPSPRTLLNYFETRPSRGMEEQSRKFARERSILSDKEIKRRCRYMIHCVITDTEWLEIMPPRWRWVTPK